MSILYWDEVYPAAWNAFWKYGASKLTYRVDEVVSGRITPTMPFPAAVRPVNWDISEKLLLNDEVLRPAGTVAEAVVVVGPVVVADVVFFEDEEHAAPTRLSVTTSAIPPVLSFFLFNTSSLQPYSVFC